MSEQQDLTRRDVMKVAGVAGAALALSKLDAAPTIGSGAPEQVKYGVIGAGGRGAYLLKHLAKVNNGRCVAVCDLDPAKNDRGANVIGTNPAKYTDYHRLLDDRNVEAVIIAVPLFAHYHVTKDTLEAGKHTFCEKSLVFKPEEVHALRDLYAKYPNQVLQVGLQRRYSKFYQLAKQMVDKGILGGVTHIHAQWHRNPGWVMNGFNWRLYRDFSGGLAAELASHQLDVADWIFGSAPEYVMGVGGLDTWHDGRDIFDNIQLIYKYPKNQKLVYSSITTNAHLPYFGGERPEFGEVIMGTEGALEMTVGDGEVTMPTALWYKEVKKVKVAPAHGKEKPAAAGASFALGAGQRGLPIAMASGELNIGQNDSFFEREGKFARRWLYSKGIMTDDEDRNPVETELESFFNDTRTGGRPKADINVGLADSTAVILSNLCMLEDRKVYFTEIDKLGRNMTPQQMAESHAKAEDSYVRSLQAKHRV